MAGLIASFTGGPRRPRPGRRGGSGRPILPIELAGSPNSIFTIANTNLRPTSLEELIVFLALLQLKGGWSILFAAADATLTGLFPDEASANTGRDTLLAASPLRAHIAL